MAGIRAATPSDLAGLAAILAETPWEKTGFVRAAILNDEVLVVDEGAGPLAFVVRNREFFERPFVWLVAVARAVRRTGLASRLFARIEAECPGERIYASTNESNAAMHAFLLERGYVRRGVVDLDPGDPEVFYAKDPA